VNIVLLMMGGNGIRVGTPVPKQFINIDGMPIFAYIMQALNDSDSVDKIVAVTHRDWLEYAEEWKDNIKAEKVHAIVQGGNTRSESVKNGLISVADIAVARDVILIHDATHPYVDDEGMKEVAAAVQEYGGATLGEFQYDTCYKMDEDGMISQVVDRKAVVAGASPEAFRFGDIYEIYMKSSDKELEAMTSAGAIALAYGIQMKVIPARVLNLKITYKEDIELFNKLAKTYFFQSSKKAKV